MGGYFTPQDTLGEFAQIFIKRIILKALAILAADEQIRPHPIFEPLLAFVFSYFAN